MIQPVVAADPDDDYLVALTRAAAADYLVSGDPHLTKLEGVAVPVLAPRAFLERLRASFQHHGDQPGMELRSDEGDE